MNNNHRQTSEKAQASNCFGIWKRVFIAIALLVQIFRISGNVLLNYRVYDSMIIKHEVLNLFDPPMAGETAQGEEILKNSFETEKEEATLFSEIDDRGSRGMLSERSLSKGLEYVEENFNIEISGMATQSSNNEENENNKMSSDDKKDWKYITILIIPYMEVLTSLTLICTIMGPLSKNVSMRQWIAWLIRMRVSWMRLMWTATAIGYTLINDNYRKCMFKASFDQQYRDGPEWNAMLGVICFEYFLLGVLECIMKITNCEVIREKISRSNAKLPTMWQRLCILTYNMCILSYAIRNFSMSLHFALLSVSTNDDSTSCRDPYTGPNLVLQIYLAIIRGRFYGFFMHGFLSTFLYEEDDPIFDKARVKKDDVSNDESNYVSDKNFLKQEGILYSDNHRNSSRFDSIT